jgi:hypothetical protein
VKKAVLEHAAQRFDDWLRPSASLTQIAFAYFVHTGKAEVKAAVKTLEPARR